MSKITSWIVLSVIFCSLLTVCSGKTCTKEQLITYVIHRMDPFTQRLRTIIQTKKFISIVCCEGYQEISRNSMHPICVPKCTEPCGHGFCSSPNVCKCDEGFEFTSLGTCILKEQLTSISPVVENPVERKPVFDVNLLQAKILELGLFTTTSTTTTKKPIKTTLSTIFKPQRSPKTRVELLEPKVPTKTTPRTEPLEPEQPVCPHLCRNGKCSADRHCDCIDGYTFDSESLQCRPLCNGKIYGCIHGTCVGYNQCRCDKGTYLPKDELFHCQSLGQVQLAITDQLPSIPSVVENPVERKPAFDVNLFQAKLLELGLFTTTSTTTTRKPITMTQSTIIITQTSPKRRAELLEPREPTKTTPRTEPLEPEQPVCPHLCRNGQCRADKHCDCIDGYTFDSESLQCRPLCNGKIYGCIHGTCVGYNQCRCDKGRDLHKDELFHCQSLGQVQSAIKDQSSEEGSFNMWYLLLLVIPCAVVVMSFCIIIRRWKQNKTNRKEAQESTFSEVRYFNSDNDHSVNEKHQQYLKPERHAIDGPSSSNSSGTIRRNGNVVIIHT